jgi:hypothetical protein
VVYHLQQLTARTIIVDKMHQNQKPIGDGGGASGTDKMSREPKMSGSQSLLGRSCFAICCGIFAVLQMICGAKGTLKLRVVKYRHQLPLTTAAGYLARVFR